MSDFDKEAEREKLREKFDRDKEKRKETERMSQLLLQGATMTNRHCDTCGDPLFRYQGQTFCATCEGRTQEATDAAVSNASADRMDADAAGHPNAGTEAAPASGGANSDGHAETVDADAAGHPAPVADARPTTPETASATNETTPTQSASQSPGTTDIGAGTRTSPGAGGSGGDLDVARASLVRTLTHHAQRAEAVDDPRRATDHLTAVREAAEALSALDGSR